MRNERMFKGARFFDKQPHFHFPPLSFSLFLGLLFKTLRYEEVVNSN